MIGAGLGGLAAAMRLGAKGYRVTVIDRLDRPGGRGSSITESGHRFDLGPTIVTVPQVLRDLWAACGRDFDRDVDLRPMDPFYEIRCQDGSHLHRAPGRRGDAGRGGAAVASATCPGYDRFLKDSERALLVRVRGPWPPPDAQAYAT